METKYVCKTCDGQLVRKLRRYKFYNNRFSRPTWYCPKCGKYRNSSNHQTKLVTINQVKGDNTCPHCKIQFSTNYDSSKMKTLLCPNCGTFFYRETGKILRLGKNQRSKTK